MQTLDQQLKLVKRGTIEVIQEKELREKFERSRRTGKPLVVKAGFDPTAPDIHLGHTVLLRKMKHFQDLGHSVVFLIGDFTGLVGDPSGVSKTRPRLTKADVRKNAVTYKKQISKILNMSKLRVIFNSRWLGRMSLYELTDLASKQTVARVLERDDFLNRYKSGQDISYLEFLYPLLQAYDSVKLQADIELGGTDQKFNMLMGRTIQERYGQAPQVVITMPLLIGLDGTQKMSKSYGNYVGINEAPKDIYGKLMSISDELMHSYYELLTDENVEAMKKDIADGRLHPKKAKSKLAKIMVAQYYGERQAQKEEESFERVFKEKQTPENTPLYTMTQEEISILDLMAEAKLCDSRSEAKRLIRQGGVALNKQKVLNSDFIVKITKEPKELKVGKLKFIRICRK